MSIWKREITLEAINRLLKNTLCEHLDIQVTGLDDGSITGTMPVDERTFQPMKILHGGASVVLAESLGSMAANMAVDDGYYCVGLDINANHIRPAHSGRVTGVAKPVHLGRTTQVWEIILTNEQGKVTCVSRLTMAVKKAGQ